MKRFLQHLIYLIVIIQIHSAYSQNDNFSFTHLNTSDGLSNSSVTNIMQDSKGFMWFATIDGLNLFDGYEFTIFRNIPSDSTSISDNKIECVFEDSSGDIWVGSRNGLNRYLRNEGVFIRYFAEEDNPNSMSSNFIRKIIQDGSGLWISTLGGGLNYYDKKKKQFTQYKHAPENPESLSMDWVWSIFIDSKNNLWAGTLGEGLNLFNRATGTFKRYRFNTENPSINRIRCMFELSDNTYLIGTDAGMIRFNPDNETDDFHYFSHNDMDRTSISGGHVRDIFEDSSGNIWVASQLGLDIFNPEDNTFSHIERKENTIYSISTDEIWDIEQDNQNNLWFGAYKGGINILNMKQKHFNNWTHQTDNPKSLVNNSVLSIEERADGKLWLGIDHGGLSLFDKEEGTIKTYQHDPKDKNSISTNAILCMMRDNNKLWLGTWGGGINLFDKDTESATVYSPETIFFRDWHVWDIIKDSKGRIWAASFSGLSYLNTSTDTFTTYIHNAEEPNSLSHDFVWTVYEDSNNNIWIGTTTGLNKYNDASNDFTYYPYVNENGLEINSYTVLSISEYKEQKLWIGTSGNGLNLFDTQTKTFKSFNEFDGLQSSEVYSIEKDKNKNLWLSTNYGLVKIKTNQNDSIVEYYTFDSGNGIRTGQFNVGASLRSKAGELIFGGNKGFVYFNPDSIKPNTFEPTVYITDFLIFNEKVPIDPEGKTNSPLRHHITETKEITLNHKQSIFSLKYAALSYIAPSKNQYAYMLEGLENKWNYVKNKRYATYTNLNAGEYTFKVKASNNDGIWSDKITTLKITILPPWWRTWWFRGISIAFLIFVAASIYFARVRQLKMQKAELERRVKERTAELQMLNVELEERQEEILQQNDKILSINKQMEKQQKQIIETNHALEKKNIEISETSEIVRKQNEHIKSAIQYAKTIQNAILPPMERISQFFESFVVYHAKDIVSGDFYWFAKIKQETNGFIFAVIDCTGHGVPGAFMSLIGFSLLNGIIREANITEPVDVLNNLDAKLVDALDREKSGNDDGMDVCLCKIKQNDDKTWNVKFAGAKRYLLYYDWQKKELNKVKGSLKSIGGLNYRSSIEFEQQELTLQSNDILYLTTDGFADQSDLERKRYSRRRLNKLLENIATQSLDKQKEIVEEEFKKHKGNNKQIDDITVAGLKLDESKIF